MMVKKIIKTEEDHQKALARIDELMDAEPNTPEGDELELLAALVELYEEKEYPVNQPDPIDAIKFRMDQVGFQQKDLIPFIGSKSKVSEVLNRKRPFSLSMIRALHKGLGIPAEILLNEPGKELPKEIPMIDWTKFPIREMKNSGWISLEKSIKGNEEDIMREYIQEAGGMSSFSELTYLTRQSPKKTYKTDKYALLAWCLRVMELSRKNPVKNEYRPGSFNLSDLPRLSYFKKGPLLAKEYLEKHGIQVFIVPHLKKTYLDGAAMILEKNRPVISLTLRHDRVDNFWFCLLHELAHLQEHLHIDRTDIIIDEIQVQRSGVVKKDSKEKEADKYAQNALIPEKHWRKVNMGSKDLAKEVLDLSEKLKIHPAIIAGRIQYEKNNYRILSQFIGRGEVSRLKQYINL